LKLSGLFLALFLTFPLLGQAPESLVFFKKYTEVGQSSNTNTSKEFESFLKQLDKKRSSLTEKEFLRLIFTKTHKTYLKKFVEFAPFNSIFEDGSYQCLTATALYALILNHFHISHEVIETNYHIFLMAKTKQGNVLLESTDLFNGFIDDARMINQKIEQYKMNTISASNKTAIYYKYSFELFNSVGLDELLGLLHYNQAVAAFNQSNMKTAVSQLTLANEFYTSSRIDEFAQLLLLSLQQSKLDSDTKRTYLKEVFTIRQKMLPSVASL
jgi:hypothetical protein